MSFCNVKITELGLQLLSLHCKLSYAAILSDTFRITRLSQIAYC
jgi:hypothetical protein